MIDSGMGRRSIVITMLLVAGVGCTPKPRVEGTASEIAGHEEIVPSLSTGPTEQATPSPPWWTDELDFANGRLRACVDAIAPTVGEARRIAMRRGLEVLDKHFPGGRPDYRLTTWAGQSPAGSEGGYRVAVLVEAGDAVPVGGHAPREGAANDGP